MDMQAEIAALAARFAQDLMALIRRATLDEIVTVSGRAPAPHAANGTTAPALPAPDGSGRQPRRTAEQLEEATQQIVDLVRMNPKGLSAQTIRTRLGIDRSQILMPLERALTSKKIKKKGKKRATMYFPAD